MATPRKLPPAHPRVKICGITTPEDLLLADSAGADYAGLILAPGSKRRVSAEALAAMGRLAVRIKRVGVFVRATPREIAHAVRVGHLQVVQLYHCTFRRAGVEVWHATPLDGRKSAIVLDAAPGQGRVGNWKKAARMARRRNIVLAGGLGPENVAAAISTVHPWAVDTASGTEAAPGRKDPHKVNAFIRKAKP